MTSFSHNSSFSPIRTSSSSPSRLPDLEDQIEHMLLNLMDEDSDGSSELHFSDESSNEIESPTYADLQSTNITEATCSPPWSFNRNVKKCTTYTPINKSQPLYFPLANEANNALFSHLLFQDIPTNRYPPHSIKSSASFPLSSTTIHNNVPNRNSLFALPHSPSKFQCQQTQGNTNMQIECIIYEISGLLKKTDKIDTYIYSKLKGNFFNIITTHRGSRMFLNYLKNTSNEIIHLLFMEIRPVLAEVITNSFSNHFCKRFYSYLSYLDRIDLLTQIKDSFIIFALDSVGTYPIQAIIEQVNSIPEKQFIIDAITPNIETFCFDTYGTHILEKILNNFEEEYTSIIYDFVLDNFLRLATNTNGICIVKRVLLEQSNIKVHNKLLKYVYEHALNLIEHPYGNYVIQIILENWQEKEIAYILSKFNGHYIELSNKKYSSNVVERCLERSEYVLSVYINEICSEGRVAEVMKNGFGNYVVQKALKISTGKNKAYLAESVNKNIYKLNDKKLITKWKSIVAPHLLV
jgi:hypothetical protein